MGTLASIALQSNETTAYLVPDDRIVGADAVEAGKEREEGVDDERDMRSDILCYFTSHGGL